MKIIVIGGSGLIGNKLVKKLRARGHEAVGASPASRVNTITGIGLSEALIGANVVADVSNSPSFEDTAVLKFFETSTLNILQAAKAAGVQHYVALSIVGADRVPGVGYMRAKIAQEKLIESSTIPYTIVRATQFFEFIGRIADGSSNGNTVSLSPVLMQPVAAEDVASAVGRAAMGTPVNGITEVAGPERLPLDDLARQFLHAKRDGRKVVTDSNTTYFGAEVNDQSLTAGSSSQIGSTRFEDWLLHSAAV